MKMALSPAAVGLLRALIGRAAVPRDRIMLSDWQSVEWESLTFVGERHKIQLRISGPDSGAVAGRLTEGLADADFAIPGQIVADITVVGQAETACDGSTIVRIEALTIAE